MSSNPEQDALIRKHLVDQKVIHPKATIRISKRFRRMLFEEGQLDSFLEATSSSKI